MNLLRRDQIPAYPPTRLTSAIMLLPYLQCDFKLSNRRASLDKAARRGVAWLSWHSWSMRMVCEVAWRGVAWRGVQYTSHGKHCPAQPAAVSSQISSLACVMSKYTVAAKARSNLFYLPAASPTQGACPARPGPACPAPHRPARLLDTQFRVPIQRILTAHRSWLAGRQSPTRPQGAGTRKMHHQLPPPQPSLAWTRL